MVDEAEQTHLDDAAEHGDAEGGHEQREPELLRQPYDGDANVRPQRVQRPVGKVDHVHQPENQRQAQDKRESLRRDSCSSAAMRPL